MLASSSYKAACSRSGISRTSFVTYAQKGGSRKQSRTRRTSSPGSETDQLLSEYKAVKQTSVSNSLTAPSTALTPSSSGANGTSSSRPAAVTRSLVTPIEAGAAAKSKKGFGRKGKNGGGARKGAPPAPPAPAAAVAPAPSLGTSKAAGGASPVAAAAAAQPPQPTAPTAADTAVAAAAGAKAPASPPLLKVAGARSEAFESKLAPKPQEASTPDKPKPPAAAAAAVTAPAPPAPVVPAPVPAPAPEEKEEEVDAVEVTDGRSGSSSSSSPVAGRALLEDSLARLAAAGDDVGAAENHVNGLAELLIDARSTLSALREDASQVGGEAENLVGIMTDLLVDLSGELGLVCDHLTSTRIDISATHAQLEAAAAATSADVEADKRMRQVATQDQMGKVTQQAERMAAAASAAAAAAEEKADAAAAAAAAAEQKLTTLQSQLQAKEAELNVLSQQNEQLRDQRTLMQQQADASAARAVAATAHSPSASPSASPEPGLAAAASGRLREVLMSQVECNMLLLDKLGALAQTVVGLPGLDGADRVKLASTISQCVLAVGAVQIPEDMLAASDSHSQSQDEESRGP